MYRQSNSVAYFLYFFTLFLYYYLTIDYFTIHLLVFIGMKITVLHCECLIFFKTTTLSAMKTSVMEIGFIFEKKCICPHLNKCMCL